MPQQNIAGTGQLLPPPQALYPVTLNNNAYVAPTNVIALKPAEITLIPAGDWLVSCTGTISAIQWLNPVTLQWTNLAGPGVIFAMRIQSDGVNFRVANLSDSWYAGIVSAAGSGYVQATTTITAGTGNSTWQPIIGGALGAFTVVSGGSGYTKTPLVFIPAPPSPGVPATAAATISGGAVTAVTIVASGGAAAGAGYQTAPPVLILPDPFDPAFLLGSIVNATATVVLAGAGTLTAALLVNAGTLLTTAPTLTVNGAGTSATATTSPATVVAAATDIVTFQPV